MGTIQKAIQISAVSCAFTCVATQSCAVFCTCVDGLNHHHGQDTKLLPGSQAFWCYPSIAMLPLPSSLTPGSY